MGIRLKRVRYFFCFLLFGCAACTSQKESDLQQASDTLDFSSVLRDTGYQQQQDHSFMKIQTRWLVDGELKTIKPNPDFNYMGNVSDSMIRYLNMRYPEIRMLPYKFSHDTLFTEISESNYLTEQMGSTGAASYLADAVLNLTSCKGVRYVLIKFKEGSHASPGIWSKHDFVDYRIIP